MFAFVANAPAFVPLFALPPAARTRRLPTAGAATGQTPVRHCKFNTFSPLGRARKPQNPVFRKFSPACGGVGDCSRHPAVPGSPFSICQNFNVLSFRALPGSPAPAPCLSSISGSRFPFSYCASRRPRFSRFPGRPRKRRGATSNTHSHSQPRGTQSWQTRPQSRHRPRDRRQHARGGRSV